jgi:SOS response regulatory protein OraA/RecX
MQKGIERKLIDKLLLDTKVDEVKIAQKLLERKSRSWERYDSDQKKQKQMEFLARRGFGWELIKKLTGRDKEE